MGVKICLQNFCYDCNRSSITICPPEGDGDVIVTCRKFDFCTDLVTRIRLDKLEKSIGELEKIKEK